ncbi:hypothetical protein EYS42_10350 [Aquabacterium lacunae]|uniref:DUF5666 domain-containing protein n=1 Tax=Aquabacterium lacunae TaxID=2528630 RepID=A0A4V2JFI1_9BURK|nr:DUF5666 domain-containing protein [Aquabacterium lacunae]TBO30100.1 hypothetical protein EYS42_10350 [Aquabacterium lacunae]
MLVLSACGGGTPSDLQTAAITSGGTGSTGLGGGKPAALIGPLLKQGTQWSVNGVQVNTSSNTAVSDDEGQPLDTAVLAEGMTVAIDGDTVSTQGDALSTQALRVRLEPVLYGPVQAMDLARRELTVMDHVVQWSDSTVLSDAWPQGLGNVQVGDLVEVHGWQDLAQTRYVATRLAPRTVGMHLGEYTVQGVLADLDLARGQCRVGTQRIAYAWPEASSDLRNGQWTRGSLYTTPPVSPGSTWSAVTMRVDAPWLTDKAQISVQGLVTAVQSGGQSFTVQSWPVNASAAACSVCPQLTPGQRVRVEGTLTQGVVSASLVKLQP